MGRVLIANISSSFVCYEVNHDSVGRARPMAQDPPPTPHFLATTLSPRCETGLFSYGENDFVVTFEDTYSPPGPHSCPVTIPTDVSTDDDLLLYVFRTGALCLDHRGSMVGRGWSPLHDSGAP